MMTTVFPDDLFYGYIHCDPDVNLQLNILPDTSQVLSTSTSSATKGCSVGTAYVQDGEARAVDIGLQIVGPRLAHFVS
ncbi:MAG: hypothetical protein IPI24_07340 [Ignavibacteria bacterium]|nr:hypothetical protein [Ignavibacteria bacterium]